MRKPQKILTILLILWWAYLLFMTHVPHPPYIGPRLTDKSKHMIAYGILGALLYINLRIRRRSPAEAVAATVAIVIAAGALDEWTQELLPMFGRTAELMDWSADITGAAVATVALAGVETIGGK